MSEAADKPVIANAASLYASDGGAAAAAGADTTPASAGNETVAGTAGTDTIAAAAGTDTVVGEAVAGSDTVAGEAGTDTITAPEYDFKLPEGFQEIPELMTEAKSVLAAAGVAPDKAQPLLDLFGKAVKASSDAQAAAHATEQSAWLTEINSMPEFTGPTRETSLASIGKLFDEFGTPEAKAALNAYGVGNNPALVKMMLKLASTISEGAPTGQGRPIGESGTRRGQPKTIGQSLYGDPKN